MKNKILNQPDKQISHLDMNYRNALMSFFCRRVNSRTEAEDLTQEVFLRILRRRSITDLSNVDAYIFKIASNVFRDMLRRKKSHHSTSHSVLSSDGGLTNNNKSTTPELLVEDIVPERVLIGRESLKSVEEVLGELDIKTRDIFLLHRLEGMNQRDIAKCFDLSVSAIEKHIMKAMTHLNKRLLRNN